MNTRFYLPLLFLIITSAAYGQQASGGADTIAGYEICEITTANADQDFCTACSKNITNGVFTGYVNIRPGVNYTISASCLASITFAEEKGVYLDVKASLVYAADPLIAEDTRIRFLYEHHAQTGTITAYGDVYKTSGTRTNFSFTYLAGRMMATASNARAMPISLTDWSVQRNGSAVALNWTTLREEDNAYFEVEYSGDGVTFTPVAKVAGAGTTNHEQHYSTTHRPAATGTAYYRLRQVDLDGTTTLFAIQRVHLAAGATASTPIFPNPARVGGTLTIAEAAGQGISLHAPNGQQLLTVAPNEGLRQRIQLPTTLTPGIYVLRIGQRTERLLIH